MAVSTDDEFTQNLFRGGELLAAGKVIEAKEYLERAHALEPRNEKGQNLLGLTYFKLGLFDRAAEIYEGLVGENPVDATLRVNLGLVYLKTQALQRAIREFEAAVDLAPEHKKAHNYLGLALAQEGRYSAAREHFIQAGSEAMAEKMERALAGETAGLARPPGPLAAQEGQKFAEIEGSEVVAERGGQQVEEEWATGIGSGAETIDVDESGPIVTPEELGHQEAAPEEPADDYAEEIGEDEVLPAKEEDEDVGYAPALAEPPAQEEQREAATPEAELSDRLEHAETYESAPFEEAAPAEPVEAEGASEPERFGSDDEDTSSAAAAGPEQAEEEVERAEPEQPVEPPPARAPVPALPFLRSPPPPRGRGAEPALEVEEWRAEPLAEVSLSGALLLSRLGADADVLRRELTAPFETRPDGVAISVSGEILSRTDGLLVLCGELSLAPELKRFHGEATDQPFGERPIRMMRATGKGALIVAAPKGTRFAFLDLGGESGFFREDVVYAFEAHLSYENGRVQQGHGGRDLDVVHLRGAGQVLLKVDGELQSARITPEAPATVPMERLVGWYGSVAPKIGEVGVELSGEGFVLFAAPMR